jgi:hypothetical protein
MQRVIFIGAIAVAVEVMVAPEDKDEVVGMVCQWYPSLASGQSLPSQNMVNV